MSRLSLLFTYSLRIVRRQWRRFVLPFVSLSITGVVFLLVLLLTSAGGALIANESRSLLGGDVVFESAQPIDGGGLVAVGGIVPERVSAQLSFTATVGSNGATAPFSLYAVDEAFPLYGEFQLREGVYEPLAFDEILLDQNGSNRLGAKVGDQVMLGEATFRVKDVIVTEPLSLLGSFSVFPRAYISEAGFRVANLDTALLRVEYRYAIAAPGLTESDITRVRTLENEYPAIDVDIAGRDQRGLQFGLETISEFLVIAVLITAVLSAVNVYASTLYLITVERRSLTILLALGLRRRELASILGVSLLCVVFLASLTAFGLGGGVFTVLREYIASAYELTLPPPPFWFDAFITFTLLVGVAIASFVPAARQSLMLEPRQILIGTEQGLGANTSWRSLLTVSAVALLPLFILASVLLGSVIEGAAVLGSIIGGYLVLSLLSSAGIKLLYRIRSQFSFFWRSIISQKVADGFFGIISLASLFVALTALFSLTLLQVSLERYLTGELAGSVPTTYVIDVQPSQKETLLGTFPDLTLYANLGARIIAIDALRIQDELERGNPEVDRELGREFNLTSRRELLASETVVAGKWSNGRPGEVSVDEEFARRANIKLGSTVEFLIQGFAVKVVVTSLRETDSRSGLPFFYFVLSPEDIGAFPSVYFGHANYDDTTQRTLGTFLAETMPNVSMIETDTVGPVIVRIVSTLLVLVLVVTLPPLFIATLLIATLVVSGYAVRRRVTARLRALGLTKRVAFWQYLGETLFITVVAAAGAYLTSVLVVLGLNEWYLELDRVTLVTVEVLGALVLVVGFVTLISVYLFRTDTMQLRELLTYE